VARPLTPRSLELSRAVAYRGGRLVLDGVSLRAEAGVTLLAGPSEITTAALEALAGVLPLVAGNRWIDGATPHGGANRSLTLTPARPWEAGHLTAERALHLVSLLWDVPDQRMRTRREVERWSLAPLLHRRMEHLSGGEQRRVLLAASLLPDPTVWLVDGGARNLDADGRAVWSTLLTRVHFGLPDAPRIAVVAGDVDPRLANVCLTL